MALPNEDVLVTDFHYKSCVTDPPKEVNIEDLLQEQNQGLHRILQEYLRKTRAHKRLEAEFFALQQENHRLRSELAKCGPEGTPCGSGETGGTLEVGSSQRRLVEGCRSSSSGEGGHWDPSTEPRPRPPPQEVVGITSIESLPGCVGLGEDADVDFTMSPSHPNPQKCVVAFAPLELAPILPVVQPRDRELSVLPAPVAPVLSDGSAAPTKDASCQSIDGHTGRKKNHIHNQHLSTRETMKAAAARSTRIDKVTRACSDSSHLADQSITPVSTLISAGLDHFDHAGSRRGSAEMKTGPKAAAVFADASAMKEKVRQAIGRPRYNVADFYHETGIAQKIARHTIFDNVTLTVIGLNAWWIWIDTDNNKADLLLEADPIFIIMENFFCIYFTIEWIVRFCAFRNKLDGFKDAWYLFDSTLVVFMVGETWVLNLIVLILGGGGGQGNPIGSASILKVLRLLRLSRMARMARLLRAMPELMVLIKGMATAARSVLFTLCLLLVIMYVFGIAFVQLMRDTSAGTKHFSNVPTAMNSLLLAGTIPDQAPLIEDVGEEHLVYRLVALFYVFLATMTVMNMLVGVLCEVVSVVSSVEKESLLVTYVKSQLQHMIEASGIDANGDGVIAKKEFETLLENPQAARALQEVGVDVIGLVDYTDFIFKGDRELSFLDFMDIVLSLRGSNTATVKDVVDLRKFLLQEFEKVIVKCGNDGHEDLCDEDDDEEEVMIIPRSTILKRSGSAVAMRSTTGGN